MDKIEARLGKDYLEHKVFELLKNLCAFYDSLSFGVMGFITMGTVSIVNIDTYVFSSMQGTLESIHDILKKGRINDAYALLRKYHDSILVNVYSNLYLEDHFSIENFVVTKIDNWLKGTEQMPSNRVINNYIEQSARIANMRTIISKDKRYSDIKDRCNDHMYYNFYKNVLLNDNEIYSRTRVQELDQIMQDVQDLFILHFAYIFYIKDIYMMSSDYIDYLDVGDTPPEDSQYWVAPAVQDIFETLIKPNRPDIAEEMQRQTSMHLK